MENRIFKRAVCRVLSPGNSVTIFTMIVAGVEYLGSFGTSVRQLSFVCRIVSEDDCKVIFIIIAFSYSYQPAIACEANSFVTGGPNFVHVFRCLTSQKLGQKCANTTKMDGWLKMREKTDLYELFLPTTGVTSSRYRGYDFEPINATYNVAYPAYNHYDVRTAQLRATY